MTTSRQVCFISALTIVLLGSAALPSQAQTSARSSAQATGQAGLEGATDGPPVVANYGQLQSVLGREVRTRVEEGMGRIIDLLVDREGRVQAAVIEFGGFLGIGTRKIAVEWPALRFETEGKQPAVIVDVTRDQLRVAPEYKPNEPAVVRKASE
jgi:PRC-barrel domain protein